MPFIEQTALADVIPLNFLVHLPEISAAALQRDEELLAQVLYLLLEVIVEQRNQDVDKQHPSENNSLLQGIQISRQQTMQGNKTFGREGMPAMVCVVKPATKTPSQIRKVAGGVKQAENIPTEWVQNIYETNPAPPQKCRNISTKYLERVKQAVLPKEQPPSIIARHILKQEEIDSLLKEFRTKQLPEWKLNLTVSELIQGYLQSTRFRAIYLYIRDNVLFRTITQQKVIQAEAQNYVIINDLLVRLIVRKDYDPKEYDKPFWLVIPEACEPAVFHIYHDSLLGGHQKWKRTCMTITDHFYIVNLAAKLKRYIEACSICQTVGHKPAKESPVHPRILESYHPMDVMSADIKVMPKGHENYQHILVVVCDATNYTVLIPLKEVNAQMVSEALIQRIFCVFTVPKMLCVDIDTKFTANVIQNIMARLKIKMHVISPMNHRSLKAERQIQTIQTILVKQLTRKGQDWPFYMAAAQHAANTFASTALGGFSPHELVFLRKPPNFLAVDFNAFPETCVQYYEYINLLKSRRTFIQGVVDAFREKQAQDRAKVQNAKHKMHVYAQGDLVAVLAPTAAALAMNS